MVVVMIKKRVGHHKLLDLINLSGIEVHAMFCLPWWYVLWLIWLVAKFNVPDRLWVITVLVVDNILSPFNK
jgi:hypothetical protein